HGEGAPEMALWDFTLGRNPRVGGESYGYNAWAFNDWVGAGFQFSDGHVAGSFPRKGLIWSFDFQDQSKNTITDWPFFFDRANYSRVMTPCSGSGYGVTPSCGTVNGSTGIHIVASGLQTVYVDTSTVGHFQVARSDADLNNTASNSITPAAMQGNGTFSTV